MKTIIKTAIAAASLGLAGAGAWYLRAADQPAPSATVPSSGAVAMAPAWLPHVVRYLKLTPDQRAKLVKIRQDHRSAAAAIRKDASLTDDQRRQKLRDEAKSALIAAGGVLTPEQNAKLNRIRRFAMRAGLRDLALRQEMRHERAFWGRGYAGPRFARPGFRGGPAAGFDRMAAAGMPRRGMAANLTPEQREKIAALTQAYREQLRAIVGQPKAP